MKNNKKLKVAIITNVIPSYREGFYDRLFREKDFCVTVYCQDHLPGINLKTIHEKYGDRVKLLKFISAPKEKISWQFLPWSKAFKHYDVVFVDGNPRIISGALISTALHVFRKKVVLWTNAHSFRGYALTENIRLFWTNFFNFIFVYTDSEVAFLRKKGFKNNYILGMNNGLDQKKIDGVASAWTKEKLQQWRVDNLLVNKVVLLSCARLEPKNRFEQVIHALPLMLPYIQNLVWCLVGDGEEKGNLLTMVKTLGLEDHVRFVGAVYEENALAPWFLSAEILIHPAAIGLTLLHSFGYGLPVITHGKAELHNPEYAAFEPENTGRNFEINDIQSLSDTTLQLLQDEDARLKMKKYTLMVAREKYNIDIMVDRFSTIAKKAYSQKRQRFSPQ